MRFWFAAILTLAAAIASADDDWQSIGPWGGYDVVFKLPDPAGTRVYASTSRGLFRSDDRGSNWTRVSTPAGRVAFPREPQVAVTRAQPDRLLAVFDDRYAYLSVDAGRSWQLLLDARPPGASPRAEFTAVAIDHHDPALISIFQGELGGNAYQANGAWWLSSDGGVTFTSSPLVSFCNLGGGTVYGYYSLGVAAAEYDPLTPGQLIWLHSQECAGQINHGFRLIASLGAVSQLLSTADTAVSSPLARPEGSLALTANHVFWRANRALLRVDRAGQNRTLLRDDARAVTVGNGNTVVASTRSGLARSDNAGDAWMPLPTAGYGSGGPPLSPYARSAALFADGRLLGSNKDATYALAPGASAWQFSATGLSGLNVSTLTTSADDDRLWAGLGSRFDAIASNYNVMDHTFVPTARVLYRSQDAGATWAYSDLDTYSTRLTALLVDPATTINPGITVLYAAGIGCNGPCSSSMPLHKGQYRSTDGGITWLPMAEPLPDASRGVPDLSLDVVTGVPAARTLYGLHDRSGEPMVLKSTDSGASWEISSTSLPASTTAPNQTPRPRKIVSSPARPQSVFLATVTDWNTSQTPFPTLATGFFRSLDGGANWQHASEGLPRQSSPDYAHVGVKAIAAHPTDPQVIWVLSNEFNASSAVFNDRVFKSVDGAASWQASTSGLPQGFYRALVVEPTRPNYLYVAGSAGVYHSNDAGANWRLLGNPDLGSIFSLAVSGNFIYAGGTYGVYRMRRPGTADPIFCSGFDPNSPTRQLRAECSGRLTRYTVNATANR